MNRKLLDEFFNKTSTYSHEIEKVEVIERHTSYVILTGELVYKFKKNIKLPYLDYSSLKARKTACHQELKLNKRYNSYYNDACVLVQINNSEYKLIKTSLLESVEWNDFTIIDYAVQMKQFSAYNTLDKIFDMVRDSHMRTLAQDIFSFHNSSKVVKNNYFSAFSRIVEENIKQIHCLLKHKEDIKLLSQLSYKFSDFFNSCKDLFIEREKRGFVRDAHGDLRLDNLVLDSDKILFFDCIDFKDDFRINDIVYDIASISSELTFNKRHDLSRELINSYPALKKTKSPAITKQLISFYSGHCAAINAKLALFDLHDNFGDMGKKYYINRYRGFLNLANEFLNEIDYDLISEELK